MATSRWTQDLDVRRSALGKSLLEHPGRFDFFQAVRVIERMSPARQPVGQWGTPGKEIVRFGTNSALAFPPSAIHTLDWQENAAPRMVVNFMGLSGQMGALPYSYSQLILERLRAKDHTMQDFLDLFNHRFLSLFYQAWEKYRFYVAYERDQQDRLSRYLLSLVGLGTEGLQDRQSIRDQSILYYVGLAALLPRSAQALQQVLEDYFDVPVAVEQFVGAWYDLDPADQCMIDRGGDYSEQLGLGAVAGDQVWDHQARARLSLGPLTIKRYNEFLPGGSAVAPLKSLLKFFSGGECEFELQLILRREDVEPCGLATEPEEQQMLGWTTWMKSTPLVFSRDPGEAVFLLN